MIGVSAAIVVVTAAIWEAVLNDLNDHLKQAVESLGHELGSQVNSPLPWVSALKDYSEQLDHEDGYEINRMEPLEKWVY